MQNPYATVVICTMSEPTKVMEGLRNQTFRDFEIIIASDEGIVKAMNHALQHAKGDIFIRIDDDVELPPEWLEELLKPFDQPLVVGVTGPTFVPKDRRENRDSIRAFENPNWFLKWLCDFQTDFPAKIHRCGLVSYASNYQEKISPRSGVFEVDHLEGTNWAMRTWLIRWVGGFDPAFDGVAEWYDTDVEQKILKLGYQLRYNVKAHLFHLLEKGGHYNQRFDVFGRIDNWLRFHCRHSKFSYKKLIVLLMWIGYALWPRKR